MRRVPPPPGTFRSSAGEARWTKEPFPWSTPLGSDTDLSEISPGRIKGSTLGRLSNTEALTPKFLARMSRGVCASQSSIWKVTLG